MNSKEKKSYINLIVDYPLISIRNKEELKKAQDRIDKVLLIPRPDKGQMAYLEALSDLVFLAEKDLKVLD